MDPTAAAAATTTHLLSLPPLLHPISPALAALNLARVRLTFDLPPSATKGWCTQCGGLKSSPSSRPSPSSKLATPNTASRKRKIAYVEIPSSSSSISIAPPPPTQPDTLEMSSSTAAPTTPPPAPATPPTPRRRTCETCGVAFAKARALEFARPQKPTFSSARLSHRTRSSRLSVDSQPSSATTQLSHDHTAPNPTPTLTPIIADTTESHGLIPESKIEPQTQLEDMSVDQVLALALVSDDSTTTPSTTLDPSALHVQLPPLPNPNPIGAPNLRYIPHSDPNPPTYPLPPPNRPTSPSSTGKGSPTPTGSPVKKRKKLKTSGLSKLLAESKAREAASGVGAGGSSWGFN